MPRACLEREVSMQGHYTVANTKLKRSGHSQERGQTLVSKSRKVQLLEFQGFILRAVNNQESSRVFCRQGALRDLVSCWSATSCKGLKGLGAPGSHCHKVHRGYGTPCGINKSRHRTVASCDNWSWLVSLLEAEPQESREGVWVESCLLEC